MSFAVSPGVEVKEVDFSNIIPAVSASIGGFAGYFRWGPVEEVTLVTSEKDLSVKFGKPSDFTASSFFTAASFLKYGNALKVVRAGDTDASSPLEFLNSSSGTASLIKNETHFETIASGLAAGVYARFPGELGNGLSIQILDSASFATDTTAGQFDSAPDVGEIHVAVLDADGEFSGTAGTVLEKWSYLETAPGAQKADGTNNYYADVINNNSNWVYIKGTTTSGDYDLSGGLEKTVKSPGDITAALEFLADAEIVDVNLLFADVDANGSSVIANKVHEIAYTRKDCVGFISPPIEDSTGNAPLTDVLDWLLTITNRGAEGSYGFADTTAVYVYNKYNDSYLWIPASGHTAGLCASTDDVAEPWFSPAGLNRGGLRGIVKLAFNPKKAERDELYKAGMNPIVSLPGNGTVLFGDKTLQAKPSAFDRINVRRLFIVLEKAIATAAKYQLFELNDEFTRSMFKNMTEPFLRDIKGRRGVTDFLVACDGENNTGEIIDSNGFVADIYIKPSRSINFITLNFIATRTGVDFSEIAGTK